MNAKRRRVFLLFVTLSLVCRGAAVSQPNIVLFFIDDMGWRDWSVGGSDYSETM